METPTIAREDWAKHPNYPEQVLLLGSHQNFRHISHVLLDELAAGTVISALEDLFRRWKSGMHSHEAYEEGKLYPFLARRYGCSFEAAKEGHQALGTAEDVVRAAFALLRKNAKDQAGRVELKDALTEHDRVLSAHLDLEEELVIPLLLSLTRAEFDDYYRLPVGLLLQRLAASGF